MTCPYCNLFLGHRASCKMLKYDNVNKPDWVYAMENRKFITLEEAGLFDDDL